MLLLSLMKSKESYERIKLNVKESEVEWEEFITSLESLQEKIVLNDYALAIADEKLWWKEDAESLLLKKEIPFIIFKGNFEDVAKQLDQRINEIKKRIEDDKLKEKKESNQVQIKYVYIEKESSKDPEEEIQYQPEKIESKVVTEEERPIKTIEQIIEKPIIIEKEIYKREKIEVINSGIIAVISGCVTGKSFLSWNLAHCYADRGYSTSVLNFDNGYSSNVYFDIDETEPSSLKILNHLDKKINDSKKQLSEEEIQKLTNKYYDMAIENAYYFSENINIYTNSICSKEKITDYQLINLLNFIQAKSQITLIDCNTGFDNVVRTAITYSNTILLIIDLDYMHWKLNLEFLNNAQNYLNPEKTIVVINNTFSGSKEINNIYNQVKDLGIPFKDIAIIKNCGHISYDLIKTDSCPYFHDEQFKSDIDILMDKLNARGKKETLIKSIFKRKIKR